jgi:hypothetical protein
MSMFASRADPAGLEDLIRTIENIGLLGNITAFLFSIVSKTRVLSIISP